jgi:hypothetical protein
LRSGCSAIEPESVGEVHVEGAQPGRGVCLAVSNREQPDGGLWRGERKISLGGKNHIVTVEHPSKAVWIVRGEYMGDQLQAKDKSEGAALKRWRERAQWKASVKAQRWATKT